MSTESVYMSVESVNMSAESEQINPATLILFPLVSFLPVLSPCLKGEGAL